MDYWRILMYVALAIPLAALCETIWRKQWDAIADRLLTLAVFSTLFLAIMPPPALRRIDTLLLGMAVALITLDQVRWLSKRRRASASKPEPPAF